jgi:cellulose 1,4-beta-cellobiosidase
MKLFAALFSLGLWFVQAQPNIFAGPMYVNPSYQADIDNTIAVSKDPVALANLKLIRNAPMAVWGDTRKALRGTGTHTVEGALMDAASKPVKQTIILVVYNLPNRDCAAHSSQGTICCTYLPDGRCDYSKNTDNCEAGLNQYKEYIDVYVDLVATYQDKVNIALVIEVDSLPNLITNMGKLACRNSERAYKDGIKYAVEQFARKSPKAWIYLDAAHGAWLGWLDSNLVPFTRLIQSMGILPYLQGFISNSANYQPLGKMCPAVGWCLPHNGKLSDPCCEDPCKLTTQYNAAVNELNYIQLLHNYFPDKKFLIDTSRSGLPNARQDCANWCNARGGLGQYPTTKTAASYIDAYVWIKPPMHTDGCTEILPDGKRCPRYDSMCGSIDSIGSRPGEPEMGEAGSFSSYQLELLARNADLGVVPAEALNPPSPPSVNPSPSKPNPPKPSPSKPSKPESTPTPVPLPAPSPSPSQTFVSGSYRITCKSCDIIQ